MLALSLVENDERESRVSVLIGLFELLGWVCVRAKRASRLFMAPPPFMNVDSWLSLVCHNSPIEIRKRTQFVELRASIVLHYPK